MEKGGLELMCSFRPLRAPGARTGSRTLDLLSVSTGQVRTNLSALKWRAGRWGTSCAAAGDGSQLVFGGGKVYPKMTGEVLVLPAGSAGAPAPIDGLAPAPWQFSEAREDCGAVGWGSKGALFAGGWVSNTEPGNPSVKVDTFDFTAAGGGQYVILNVTRPPRTAPP